jgi:hypothetical protein
MRTHQDNFTCVCLYKYYLFIYLRMAEMVKNNDPHIKPIFVFPIGIFIVKLN